MVNEIQVIEDDAANASFEAERRRDIEESAAWWEEHARVLELQARFARERAAYWRRQLGPVDDP